MQRARRAGGETPIVRREPVFAAVLAVLLAACGSSQNGVGSDANGVRAALSSAVSEAACPDQEYRPSSDCAGLPAPARRLSSNGATLVIPAGWDGRVLFLDPRGGRQLLQIANFALPNGDVPPSSTDGEDPLKAMDGDDVLVTIEPAARGDVLDGRLAIGDRDFFPSSSAQVPRGHAIAQRSFCAAGRCFELTADFGEVPPDPAIAEAVNQILATLTVAPAQAREPEAPAGWLRHSNVPGRVALAYPPGWQVLGEPLLPALADPKEILALATFPATAGGRHCAHLPENALAAMGDADALIILMERAGNPPYPRRPIHFGPRDGYATEAVECLEHPRPFRDWLIGFEDSWRNLLAYVAIGPRASERTVGEAWGILDSLVVEPPAP